MYFPFSASGLMTKKPVPCRVAPYRRSAPGHAFGNCAKLFTFGTHRPLFMTFADRRRVAVPFQWQAHLPIARPMPSYGHYLGERFASNAFSLPMSLFHIQLQR